MPSRCSPMAAIWSPYILWGCLPCRCASLTIASTHPLPSDSPSSLLLRRATPPIPISCIACSPPCSTQSSFTHAFEVLDSVVYALALVPSQEFPRMQQRRLTDLREPSTLLPPRRLRFYPRVVKRAYSPFHRKRPGQQGFTLKKQRFCDILLI